MVASVSFVSRGTFNHVFPSLPMQGKFSRQRNPLSYTKFTSYIGIYEVNLVKDKGFLCQLIYLITYAREN